MRRYLTQGERRAAGRFIFITCLGAAIIAMAVVVLIKRQVDYERTTIVRQTMTDNQNRARTFEQYVLRTLDLANLTIADGHRTSNFNERGILSSSSSIERPFTAIFDVRSGIASGDRPGAFLNAGEVRDLEARARASKYVLTVTPPIKFAAWRDRQLAILGKAASGMPSVIILMEPRALTQFADQIPFSREDLISLIGLDGVTRARRTGDILSGGESVKGLVMDRQMAAPNGSYLGPSVIDGKLRYFSHRRLPQYGLFVTSGTPATLVDQRLAHRRRSLTITMAVALALIASIAAALIGMRLTRARRLGELMVANRRLSEAQAIGRIGDWDYDHVNDRLSWSDQLLDMYGRHPDNRVSTMEDVRRYVKAKDISMIEAAMDHVLDKGEPTSWEVTVLLDGGQESMRRVNAAPVFDTQGQIVGVHGTDQDITAEVRVRELEGRVAELARLDSMSALAATLAHELNQPLGVATNYIGAARLVKPDQSGKIEHYLSAAIEQLQHLSQIVDSARDLVVHKGTSMAAIDLKSAFASTITLLRSTEPTRRSLFYTTIEKGLATVMANESQIRQVLFNLGKNAVDAVPADRRPEITFRAFIAGCKVEIEVEDNGCGFADPDVDPFAALSTSKSRGLGLGLAIARTIVEAHGGRIWISRTNPTGTVVTFSLQIAH